MTRKKRNGFGHEKPGEGETNDWITPKHIIDAFDAQAKGKGMYFDLDPCVSMTQPWLTARNGYNAAQDGLALEWRGTVYCNPPYGGHVANWAKRMADHNNGVMLIFARLETEVWQTLIFPNASGILFPKGRIAFCHPDGTPAEGSSGAPSAFVAFGERTAKTLLRMAKRGVIAGAYLDRPLFTTYRGGQ